VAKSLWAGEGREVKRCRGVASRRDLCFIVGVASEVDKGKLAWHSFRDLEVRRTCVLRRTLAAKAMLCNAAIELHLNCGLA
jgi:hypothetical protein